MKNNDFDLGFGSDDDFLKNRDLLSDDEYLKKSGILDDDDFLNGDFFLDKENSADDFGGLEDIDWSKEADDSKPPRTSHFQPESRYNAASQSEDNQRTNRTRSYNPKNQARVKTARPYDNPSNPRADKGRRRKRHGNLPLIIIAVVLVIGMVIAGWKLISILLNYQLDRSAYKELAENAITALAETEEDTSEENTDTTEDTDEEEEEEESSVSSAVPIIVDWEYLQSINSDIIGWLYCPDTVINYPVVQSDDNDYYLKRGFDQASNTSGTLFADTNTYAGSNLCNLIIYGHNMKDNSMFGTLESYVNQSYYDEHPIMYYLTPTVSYRVDLIASHIVESSMDNYPYFFDSVSAYQTYLNEITSSSMFTTNATVGSEYQLITLSTCDYSAGYSDPRFLLHGLLVPIE